jgi:hypothetical protein
MYQSGECFPFKEKTTMRHIFPNEEENLLHAQL